MREIDDLVRRWIEKADHDLGTATLTKHHIPAYKDTSGLWFVLLLLCTSRNAISQENSSYEATIDPRNIAMGQSFVATSRNFMALSCNPAGLSHLKGVHASYAQRGLDWWSLTKDFKYHSANVSVTVPFAVFGFSYNRLSLGEFTRSNENGVEIGRFTPHEHTFTLGASHSFAGGLSVGASVKTFNFVDVPVTSSINPDGFSDVEKTLPILFDIGALYGFSFINDSSTNDDLSIGFSLQNFGSNFIIEDKMNQFRASDQLNRYLRVGFAYSVVVNESPEALIPFKGMATLEYRKLLNGFSSAQSDFYGFGIEAQIFEIVSARLGGFLSNIRWIYGEPKSIAMRYGFGVNIPFSKIGIETPFTVRFDYAAIPINEKLDISGILFFRVTNKTLRSFSIALEYESDVF